MNLDDPLKMQALDKQNMLAEIDGLPAQLESAWEIGSHLTLSGENVSRVVICGMGGSAIGADLLAAYVVPSCRVPVTVHRDYGLPAWATGEDTLLIASSHSGNTEETLDSFAAGLKARCRMLVITTGGELELAAQAVDVPVWKFSHSGQPRAAVGYSFGLLLAAMTQLALIPDPAHTLQAAVNEMRSQQGLLTVDVLVEKNPAKSLATQMLGRWITIYGSGTLAPVARRWKGQVNEIAKAGAGFEILPEADHNALAGLVNPEIRSQTMTIFLTPGDHPRNQRRLELTRQSFIAAGLQAGIYTARGDSSLAQMWTALHFGDYTAYYLAMLYGMDPTPVQALQDLKAALK
jgi:glucose/mannose-6-phosphate isomerase